MSEHGIVTITIPVETLERRVRAAIIDIHTHLDAGRVSPPVVVDEITAHYTDRIVRNIITGHKEATWRD